MLMIIFLFFFLVILLVFLWEKRRLLYYASKIDGPFAVPLVGTFFFLTLTKKNFMKMALKAADAYRPVGKIWVGPKVYFVTSRPKDVETVLTTCLSKSSYYVLLNDFIGDSLLTSKVDVWKEHRKIITPTFNKKTLDSSHSIFVRYGKKMAKFLDGESCKIHSNIMNSIFQKTLDIALETLTDVKPSTFEDRYFAITAALKTGELFIERFYKFWLLLDFFWKFSSLRKEQEDLTKLIHARQQKLLMEWKKEYEPVKRNGLQCKRFLPHLMKLCDRNKITSEEILNESIFMFMAASETTASALNSTLTILGILDDIQNKVYEELVSVLSPVEKDPTIGEINRLDYLERVIKESMRIFPVVPFIMRKIETDIQLDQYLFPAGCDVIIPIATIHSDPNVWPDPQKFDPDRFLPEEVAKRRRGSYIPFSYGARNCIGLKYAMMSMKVMLAVVLKEFRVKTVGIKSLEDIELEFHMTMKPTNDRLIFEKRMR